MWQIYIPFEECARFQKIIILFVKELLNTICENGVLCLQVLRVFKSLIELNINYWICI